jgi:sugar (pentulose or hexulose) kinase
MGSIEGMLLSSFPQLGGVRALPFLSPSGERAPFVDPRARGQFTGIDLHTTSAEMVRAVCEGIAFGARHCLETAGLGDAPIRLTGGGARSPQWVKIFADVLGRPVYRMLDEQVGARGAVKTALSALDIDHEPAEWTSRHTVIEPDEALLTQYEESYRFYLDAVQDARQSWGRRAQPRASDVELSDY